MEGKKLKKAIITVLGKDSVGIIAKVCTYLANNNVNILDINQTITGGFFNMMKAEFFQSCDHLTRMVQFKRTCKRRRNRCHDFNFLMNGSLNRL